MRVLLFSFFVAGAAHAGVAELRREVEAFAGQPVMIDPRLRVPDCAAYDLGWRDARHGAVVAACPANGWRMVLPVGARLAEVRAEAVVKRGDPVQVEAAGAGYRLLVDAIAEGEGRRGGRVVVRNLNTGRRMIADIGADGVLRLPGKNLAGSP